MQYFFNDHLRWSLGWETPNQAGAFIATLLPWLWGLALFALGRTVWSQGGRRCGWRLLAVLFVAMETVATWALVKTYSRGALVAVLASLGLVMALTAWRVFRRGRGYSLYASSLAPWLGRSALLAVCLWVSGFDQRLSPDYAATDKSVLNRVDLWKGGLELIAISPVRGWGLGNSGASFMHWTQPIGRSEGYKSMVNSYLTVAVEGGLPVFALVLCACASVLFTGLRSSAGRAGPLGPPLQIADTDGPAVRPCLQESPSWLSLAATTSWLAWLVCLFFSNLWIIPWLWAVPGVTLLMIVRQDSFCGRLSGIKTAGWRLIAGAVTVSLSLWLAGRWLESASPVVIHREGDGVVSLALRNAPGNTVALDVLPDAQVLGEAYGQELRRWVLAAKASPVRLQVIGVNTRLLPAGETMVAFGAACSDARLRGRKVLLIHPTVDPDSGYTVATGSVLQLSGIDVMQKNAAWSAWATERELGVAQSWGLATDVRARWPELILELQSAYKAH